MAPHMNVNYSMIFQLISCSDTHNDKYMQRSFQITINTATEQLKVNSKQFTFKTIA